MRGAPIVASVMGAIDDVEAKAALLEAAMRWPGHHNDTKAIPTGADLMDHMLYAGYCYDQINGVIVQLAQHAGLVLQRRRPSGWNPPHWPPAPNGWTGWKSCC